MRRGGRGSPVAEQSEDRYVALVEMHARERKQQAGARGTRRGQDVAAQEAAGTAPGSFGLIAPTHERWPNILLVTTSGRARPARAEIPDDGHFVPKPLWSG